MLLEPTYSALADSFEVTSNKNVYTSNERVIIVGVAPSLGELNETVKVSVIGPDGQSCGPSRYISPDSDNYFVSRPMVINSCGTGTYKVVASYSNLSATTTFDVAAPTVQRAAVDAGVQTTMSELYSSEAKVIERIKQLADSDAEISQALIEKYQQAKSHASSAVQALSIKNWVEAKSQSQEAIAAFNQIANELPVGNAEAPNPGNNYSGAVVQKSAPVSKQADPDDELSIIADGISSADSLSQKLQRLATSNDVNDSQLIHSASNSILVARNLLAANDIAGARDKLFEAHQMLGQVQADLRDHAQQRNLNSTLNDDSASSNAAAQAKLLRKAADRIQKSDLALQSQNITDQAIQSKIQDSLSYIASAQSNIDKGNLVHAREDLSNALSSMVQAKAATWAEQSHHSDQPAHQHKSKNTNDH